MKNMIEDYVKSTPIKIEDKTVEAQKLEKNIEWQLLLNSGINLIYTKIRPDRITMICALGFQEKLIEKLDTKNPQINNIVNQINGFVVSKDMAIKWMKKEDKITGFQVTEFIDESELSRPFFYRKFENIQRVANYSQRQLVRVTSTAIDTKDIQDASENP